LTYSVRTCKHPKKINNHDLYKANFIQFVEKSIFIEIGEIIKLNHQIQNYTHKSTTTRLKCVQAYHGAKNLRKTVLPAVAESKLSGVKESTAALDPVTRPARVRKKRFMFSLNIYI